MAHVKGHGTIKFSKEEFANLDLSDAGQKESAINHMLYMGLAVSYQPVSLDSQQQIQPHTFSNQMPPGHFGTSTPAAGKYHTHRQSVRDSQQNYPKFSNDWQSPPVLSPVCHDPAKDNMGINFVESPMPVLSPEFYTHKKIGHINVSPDTTIKAIDSDSASFVSAHFEIPNTDLCETLFETAHSDVSDAYEDSDVSETDEEFHDALDTAGEDADTEITDPESDSESEHVHDIRKNSSWSIVNRCNMVLKMCRKNGLTHKKPYDRKHHAKRPKTDLGISPVTKTEENFDVNEVHSRLGGRDLKEVEKTDQNVRNSESKVLDMRKYLIDKENAREDVLTNKRWTYDGYSSTAFGEKRELKPDFKHDLSTRTVKSEKSHRHPLESLYEKRRDIRAKASRNLINIFVCGCSCSIGKSKRSKRHRKTESQNKRYSMHKIAAGFC